MNKSKSVQLFSASTQGSGTINDPYIVTTRSELEEIRNKLNGHFKLGNDINLENVEWEPIGNYSTPFTGSLDGCGYTISNLMINKPSISCLGLFGASDNTVIKNLNMKNINIKGARHVGSLIGYEKGNANIENCSVIGIGKIIGNKFTGGLMGIGGDSRNIITNCLCTIDIEGNFAVGGLVGTASGLVSKCYATGKVVGKERVGGLLGCIGSVSGHKLIESYATGDVIGNEEVGGLIGYMFSHYKDKILVENCLALGDVTSGFTVPYLGGLIGKVNDHDHGNIIIKNCYYAGEINTKANSSYVGGLIGHGNQNAGQVIESYFDSTTTGLDKPDRQARTIIELMTKDIFVGWDFNDTWDINNGNSYPYLRNLNVPSHKNMPDFIEKVRYITTESTPHSITLSWNEISDATRYEIEVDGVIIENGNNTNYTHNGLESDTEHKYRIRAKDDIRFGQWSDLISVKTDILIGAPTNIKISRTEESITVTWDALDLATGYEIEVDGVVIDNGNIISYEHTGLVEGSEHTYRIRGIGNRAEGLWSEIIIASTFYMTLAIPSNIIVQEEQSAIMITWGTVDKAIKYEIEVDGVIIDNGNSTSYEHKGLIPEVEHSYKVRAKSTNEMSKWSDTLTGELQRILVKGLGTIDDPYIIITNYHLAEISVNLSAHYKLGNDIDLGNMQWTPIGSSSNQFTGSLNGNGYKIKNLKIDKETESYIGLFGFINGATIKNLKIENVDIKGVSYVGALVGRAGNSCNINNCTVEGQGRINGIGSDIGGLIGIMYGHGRINNCSSKISVEGKLSNVGGLAGCTNEIYVSKCYATGNVTSSRISIGGLIGCAHASQAHIRITESYGLGNVSGLNKIGGLIGEVQSYNKKKITVENCFALGSVTSSDTNYAYTGGLIGELKGYSNDYKNILRNSYSIGKVNSSTGNYTGGLIGGYEYSDITNCYYDGIASKYIPKNQYDNSKLTSGMKAQATFIGWNFDNIWNIDEGNSYPYLRNLTKPLEVTDGLPEDKVADGIGTAEAPYIIETKEQLNNAKYDLTGHYKLGNDVDLENEEWEPIGKNNAEFTGEFDGNGYKIKNLKIDKETESYIGLFGHINGATIKNLKIENVDIKGVSYVGSLVGRAENNCNINNCTVEGQGRINGRGSNIGGLIGRNYGGYGKIENCSSKISVEGSGSMMGGLVGSIDESHVIKCYSTGNVTNTSSRVGGLIGYANANENNVIITESYGLGNVSGLDKVGGLIGEAYSSNKKKITIDNCLALGDVTSSDTDRAYAGGLIGVLDGDSDNYKSIVRNSYSIGKVNSSTSNYTGGLVGENDYGDITNCYYDGIASKYIPKNQFDNSKLTSAMKAQVTFTGWDFTNIWKIDEGNSYPYLRNLTKPVGVTNGLPEDEVAGGIGTAEAPYIIETKEQLNNAKYDLTGHYKLGNDIDLENEEWEPIGKNNNAAFAGSFDGRGYKIKNLKISKERERYIGVFGYTDGATIKNIKIENVDIEGIYYVGALVGRAENNCNINNCTVEGLGRINGIGSEIGGLIGSSYGGYGKIENCSSKIRVEGSGSMMGGLVGFIYGNYVIKSYSTGDVTSTRSRVGGLIGYANANENNVIITESYGLGNVSGLDKVGGLIGEVYSSNKKKITVENCFALGNVTSSDTNRPYTGGLIGLLDGDSDNYKSIVRNSYSKGKVNSSTSNYTGGLIGGYEYSDITNCYYDGITSEYIPKNQYDNSKLTSGMKAQATFTGWDFTNIWNIDEGNSYPYLRNLTKPLEVTDGLPEDEVADGIGTAEAPYIIETKEQLNNAKYDLTGHYKLGNDIDLENEEWEPIGKNNNAAFAGSFDGRGYKIKNLKISKERERYIGVFGYTDGATIKNIKIENVDIEGIYYVGALVGRAENNSNINNCTVEGVGRIKGIGSEIGGLIGSSCGGYGKIENCSSKIRVEGSGSMMGGLVGFIYGNYVIKSYSTGDVTSTRSRVGGLIGYANANKNNVIITESYGLGNVSGLDKVGGLIGEVYSSNKKKITVENCFALGSVTSSHTNYAYVGGLIGVLYGDSDNYKSIVRNSYSIGKVNSSTSNYTGGLIGRYYYSNITNSYYNTTTTSFTTPPGQPKTTEELMQKITFAGWDFQNKWQIEEGSSYPYLRALLIPIYPNFPFVLEKTNLNISNKTYDSIEVTWDFVTGAEVYELEVDGSIINVTDTTYNHTGLVYNTDHSYRVRAKLGDVYAEWSNIIVTKPKMTHIPIPTNISTETTEKSIKITWDQAQEVTGYDIEVDGVVIDRGTNTSYVHLGLEPNSRHKYKVRAKIKHLIGEWSSEVSVSTDHVAKPTDITIEERTRTSIKITWGNVENAIGYDIEVDGVIIDNGINTSYNHVGLTELSEHKYRIRAKSNTGTGKWSQEVTTTTVIIEVPSNIKTTPTENSITVTWDEVTGATNYEIEADDVVTVLGNTTSYEHTDLQVKTQHNYRIRTVEGNCKSDWSESITVSTIVQFLDAPTNIDATIGSSLIIMAWDAVDKAEEYEIEVDGKVVNNGNSRVYHHTDLELASQHTYRIRAKAENVSSEWSELRTLTTLDIEVTLITNKQELREISNDVAANYILANDIDLENEKWQPVGNKETPYTGIFDGKGHKILNLNIDKEDKDYVGLFGCLQGEIQNLIIENANVKGRNNVGTLVGYAKSGSKIEKTKIEGLGKIYGNWSIGGLLGRTDGVQIKESSSILNVESTNSCAGGLAGNITNAQVEKCYSLGDVTGKTEVGGLIGYIDENSSVKESYSHVNVFGKEKYIGGLLGAIHGDNVIIENSLVLGKVEGLQDDADYVGSLLGYDISNTTVFKNCYASAALATTSIIKSGLAVNGNESNIANCYFNSDDTGIVNPKEQSKTTEELTNKSTFTNWDFVSMWNIKDGSSYPYLRSLPAPDHNKIPVQELAVPTLIVNETTDNSILLTWDDVYRAEGYDIEIDGVVVHNGSDTSYSHTNLQRNTEYKYRVRAKAEDIVGQWSDLLIIKTHLIGIPRNLTVEPTETSITVTWDEVQGATGYDIEIDGVIKDNKNTKVYKHMELEQNTTCNYRVRVKDGDILGKWSKIITTSTLPENAIVITNKQELKQIVNDLTANYILGNDIDLENESWEPIGNQSKPFSGIFNGKGYRIRNLKVSKYSTDNVGLFGVVTGEIKEVTIENVEVRGKNHVGALAGYVKDNESKIENCRVIGTGKVEGSNWVGGLVGTVTNSMIKMSQGEIEAIATAGAAGGLIGEIYSTEIEASLSSGKVTGINAIGGLVGKTGGNNSSIKECYALGDVEGTGDQSEVGGLVGEVTANMIIENSFALGEVKNNRYGQGVHIYAGGLVGNDSYNCYNYVTIINSYAAGKVIAYTSNRGGLIGSRGNSGQITSCYYDGNTTEYIPTKDLGNSRLTPAMERKSNYEGWDFENIWEIEEEKSYPYLRRLQKPEEVEKAPKKVVEAGLGTKENPYVITTKEQLNNVKYDPESHYVLGSNIDLENEEWEPIGNQSIPFSGSFNGKGYRIRNLKADGYSVDYIGLFGVVTGEIKEVTIENVEVRGKNHVGALAGYVKDNESKIENCRVIGTGKVEGSNWVGGLVGTVTNSMIKMSQGEIEAIATAGAAGGLIGEIYSTEIETSLSSGKVTGINAIGGLVGKTGGNNSSIKECYALGDVEGTGDQSEVGGLVGEVTANMIIENSFALGEVKNNRYGQGVHVYAGGLVGNDSYNCYNYVTIINSYVAGKVIAYTSNNGGLIGSRGNSGQITSCYYDGNTTEYIPTKDLGNSRLTPAMERKSNYEGWDFENIWEIEEERSYPYLRRLPKPEEVEKAPKKVVEAGLGTKENPYVITTKEQLNNVKYDPASHYVLGNNIDLENEGWEPIGNQSIPFSGSFNGKGYNIRNLKVSKYSTDNVGLFGVVTGEIKEVTIENAEVRGKNHVGALAGYVKDNESKIENCRVIGTGKVEGSNWVGGLVGTITNSMIKMSQGEIEAIATAGAAGGLIGEIYSTEIETSLSSGKVTGINAIGGLVGKTGGNNSSIKECYALGNVEGTGDQSEVGGLVGEVTANMIIENSFALGEVKNNRYGQGVHVYAGGLVGNDSYNCYNYVTIINSYAAGKVIAYTSNKGGLIGSRGNSGQITSCYYDGNTTEYIPVTDLGSSRLTPAMKREENYEDWNFENIWEIEEERSYPYLRRLPKPEEVEKAPKKAVEAGLGTKESPYVITTKEQLNNVKYDPASHYVLGNNIDLENEGWEPIGNQSIPFSGSFNGKGYNIRNLKVSKYSTDNVGLFGVVTGEIKEVTIENAVVRGEDHVGALAGYVKDSKSKIQDCKVVGTGKVEGNTYVGGLVGTTTNSRIEMSQVEIEVIATGEIAGGLAGYIYQSEIETSLSSGKVTGIFSVGGLVGYINGQGNKIKECYVLGDVEVNQSKKERCEVGGLVGKVSGPVEIGNSFVIGEVKSYKYGENVYVGGLLGLDYSNATITNSYAAGKVAANTVNEGGLVGRGNKDQITSCYYDGNTTEYIPVTDLGSSRLTPAMKREENYEDWDFENIWEIEEERSYPYLRRLPKPEEVEQAPKKAVEAGLGTKESPYVITTKEQLNNVKYDPESHYVLGNNIDLENEGWESIGNQSIPFSGSFNGKGYNIRNLKVSKYSTDNVGLFGVVTGEIKEVTIENAAVRGKNHVGALAGYVKDNESKIENCRVIGIGKIEGNSYVGGLLGSATKTSLKINQAKIEVIASSGIAGGLVGYINQSEIQTSLATGKVIGGKSTGGLVGYISGQDNKIKDCYSAGDVEGTSDECEVGGLVGDVYGPVEIENTFALGQIKSRRHGRNVYVGGLIGRDYYNNYVSIVNSYTASQVVSNTVYKGSLAGKGNMNNFISCYFNSTIADIEIPEEKTKTTQELMHKLTFKNWDFEDAWDIEEGSSYPFLRTLPVVKSGYFPERLDPVYPKVTERTLSSIGIAWNDVDQAEGYEIEIDGEVIDLGSATTYLHTGLNKGEQHIYKIRAYNSKKVSSWTPRLILATLIDTPTNISAVEEGNKIKVSWNSVDLATGYVVEVNGTQTYTTNTTTYIHEGTEENKQYYYRVRAINKITTSEWSEVAFAINWSDGKPAICLSMNNWIENMEENNEVEVIVKANGFEDLYTIQFDLQYDQNKVKLDSNDVKDLMEINEDNKYFSVLNEAKRGVLKVLLSATGDTKGKQGQFDIMSIKLKINSNKDVELNTNDLKVVDSIASYINIPQVLPLTIKPLKKIQY